MLIDNSYFLNKSVFIPNAVAQPSIGSNSPTSINQLQQEIDEKEQELLISALGYAQFELLKAQLVPVTNAWVASPVQKWVDLVDGVIMTDGRKWNGLRYTIGTKKISPIAFYVFFRYLADDFSTYSTTGIQVANAENSDRQLPNGKQAKSWNRFVEMWYGNKPDQTNPTMTDMWNGTAIQWGGSNKNEVSLYEFLTINRDVYDVSFFSFKNNGVINAYNL